MDASSIRTSWRIAALILAVHVAASVQGLNVATTRQHKIPCIRLFDVATGAMLHQFVRPGRDFGALAFSPDGRMLAAATANTTLLFDVAWWTGADNLKPQSLSTEQMTAAWEKLGSTKVEESYAAMAQLRAAGPSSVEFISRHMQPLEDTTPSRQVLTDLYKQLDDEKYTIRERAEEQLARFGLSIVPKLETLSRDSRSLEVRFRARSTVRKIFQQNGFVIESAEKLRAYRAIQVLEQFGTPAADELLKQFASGVPGRQTTEAQLAVERRSRSSR